MSINKKACYIKSTYFVTISMYSLDQTKLTNLFDAYEQSLHR